MKIALHWQVLIAIALAVVVGSFTEPGSFGHQTWVFIGALFLNALKMVIVPLVTASIICAVAGLGGGDIGRLGGKTILFYLLTSSLAIAVGLTVINFLAPGAGDASQNLLSFDAAQVEQALAKAGSSDLGDMLDIFLRMVPPNIVAAAAAGQMLGLIFFSAVFGFFLSRLDNAAGRQLHDFWKATQEVMMRITHWILGFAPFGVFGLVAKTVAETGFAAFAPLLTFFFGVVLALLVHMLVTQSLLLYFIGGIKPWRHLQALAPALLTAFSTSSSSATLPVTLECSRQRAGVSERTSGFVLPLGATVNMDGTALYECAAVLFIAQVYGVELGLVGQLTVVLTALLTSIGVAGIPSASLVAITVILGTLGLPLEGIGLLLITDRVLDMLRTATNVYGDACGAAVIARSEGERLKV